MQKDGSVSIYYKNIQILVVEMFKIKNGMSPAIASNILLGIIASDGNYNNLRQP